jgi:hypothetical protein
MRIILKSLDFKIILMVKNNNSNKLYKFRDTNLD